MKNDSTTELAESETAYRESRPVYRVRRPSDDTGIDGQIYLAGSLGPLDVRTTDSHEERERKLEARVAELERRVARCAEQGCPACHNFEVEK